MTPPAAAAPRTRTNRTAAPPRRVSGPARRRAHAPAGPPPLALRIGGAVHGLAEHRMLERIIRGRAWIAIVGIGLIGIVFMQVSMLRLNAGIGRAVDTATRLERDNSVLRGTISELSSGDHIEAEAARMGLVLPTATPRFLDARRFDLARAVSSITPPGHLALTSTPAVMTTPALTASQLAPTGVAPASGTTTATTATTTTTSPATTTTAPAATTTTAPPATSTSTAPVTPTQQTAQPAASAPPSTTGGAAATGQGG
ncbi:MAG: hypothetical protein QOF12_1705 [Solirubrobacteraceae bacterium]|jgi:hypothetical protein|nr:hypothetical protein [Solirubrobacteraceae bacterium]